MLNITSRRIKESKKSRESISRRNCWEKNPDFHIEDLHNAIENQEFPSWTLSVQIIPYADALTMKETLFDVTKKRFLKKSIR